MRILLVEDELSIAEPLVEGLQLEGHDVVHVARGADVPAELDHDVVLLDLRLPDVDGLDVCRSIRSRSDVPIIMVTARGEEIDKVLGLELGADDYLVKPFGFRELLARIGAVTRRHSRSPSGPTSNDRTPLQVGVLTIDRRAHRVQLADDEIELTPTEFALLADLASHPGAARSRDDLMRDVWNTSWTASTKTVDVHMASLRRKLGDPNWIQTIRGVGYRLVELG